MLEKEEQLRYKRHTLLPEIGVSGQLNFKTARILVIGAGGLGCPALQYLAGAGIGHIAILDGDTVDLSNLQRQVLYHTTDIGLNKAECAAHSLQQLNPDIEIIALPFRLDSDNAIALIQDYDLILDGSDNFETRYLVNDACVISGKPFISGSVYRFEGQLSVFNYKGGPTYRCLYPEPNDIGNCEETGVLGTLPGTVGCLMAGEALKIISGAGIVLSETLLIYNSLSNQFSSFRFSAMEENQHITSLLPYEAVCFTAMPEISAEEFRLMIERKEIFQLIDVREPEEYQSANLSGVLIPLASLSLRFGEIRKDIPVIIHCQGGKRSLKALEFLKEKGFTNVRSLTGGIAGFLPNN
jgi:molybdopterin/thiamine biosynthesis adenylyltransferase/rhodanese-related sulfurtransferase